PLREGRRLLRGRLLRVTHPPILLLGILCLLHCLHVYTFARWHCGAPALPPGAAGGPAPRVHRTQPEQERPGDGEHPPDHHRCHGWFHHARPGRFHQGCKHHGVHYPCTLHREEGERVGEQEGHGDLQHGDLLGTHAHEPQAKGQHQQVRGHHGARGQHCARETGVECGGDIVRPEERRVGEGTECSSTPRSYEQ